VDLREGSGTTSTMTGVSITYNMSTTNAAEPLTRNSCSGYDDQTFPILASP
jgi:hypothetical protein